MVGKKFVHIKSGNIYKVIDVCKIQIENTWIDGVIYESNFKDKLKFVRSLDNFKESFKEFKKEEDKKKIINMKKALLNAEKSYCNKKKVGVIIVSEDDRTLVDGFNGTISGAKNECEDKFLLCDFGSPIKMPDISTINADGSIDIKCPLHNKLMRFKNPEELQKRIIYKTDHSRVVHAEANSILYASKKGISLEGATMYATLAPCSECAKMIASAGIKKVYYIEPYKNSKGLETLIENNVEVERMFIED